MQFRAVIFDLDDTLTDDTGSMKYSVRGTAEYIVQYCPALDTQVMFDAYWRESDAVWTAYAVEQQSERGEDTGYLLRCESWRRALGACGIDGEVPVAGVVAEYARLREESLQLVPGVMEMLTTLRLSFRTGIITNGPADIQRWKLRNLGLESCVDYSITSEEFGYSKPNPKIFLHVAEKLGIPPEACIMVGDHPRLDISGAHAAGMRGIWIDHKNRKLPEGIQPDHVVMNIYEVAEILFNK